AQLALHLADTWRNPVMIMGDFLLSHTSELVEFRPPAFPELPPKTWAITGANGRRGITLSPLGPPEKLSTDIAAALAAATAKHVAIKAEEVRAETCYLDGAELVVLAFGFSLRLSKYSVRLVWERGLRVCFGGAC